MGSISLQPRTDQLLSLLEVPMKGRCQCFPSDPRGGLRPSRCELRTQLLTYFQTWLLIYSALFAHVKSSDSAACQRTSTAPVKDGRRTEPGLLRLQHNSYSDRRNEWTNPLTGSIRQEPLSTSSDRGGGIV
ncbi:hypothetical protein F2P81_014648 [Scophthalmus maximus]|uniref:Uncharacterized protein n=1 Tax=Scophthalmus maximus TaxID=52904 RepID=A0A6A4SJN1_SCOMX|nr:hypothetical protein F2P81_014648 [Scophthalmus maximus]